jgi:hypothetical protein
MITIEIRNVTSTIVGFLHKDTITKLHTKLSYEIPGAFFASRYNPYAGHRYLYSKPSQSFPTGLIHYVEEILKEDNIEYELLDKRIFIAPGQELPFYGPILRDYQEDAVKLSIEKQRGIIKSATGSGKSAIIARIISKLNVPTLVLTHKTDLLYQLKGVLETFLKIPIGIIGDGEFEIQTVTVGTIQTVAKVFQKSKKKPDSDSKKEQIQNLISSVKCLITDETHHVAADSFWLVHKKALNAFYKFGLSASPWREDGCFSSKTDIILADGSKRKIKTIVDNKEKINVLSFNLETKQLEPTEILEWHKKIAEDYLIEVTLKTYGSKSRKIVCTPEHSIYVKDKGWIFAENLLLTDIVLCVCKTVVNKGKKGLQTHPWNGKTLEEVLGIEKARELKHQISQTTKNTLKEIKWSEYMRKNNPNTKVPKKFGGLNPMYGKPA